MSSETDEQRAHPWMFKWQCSSCSAKQDYRAGDRLRFFIRRGPPCPIRREHSPMELVRRNLDERGPKRVAAIP